MNSLRFQNKVTDQLGIYNQRNMLVLEQFLKKHNNKISKNQANINSINMRNKINNKNYSVEYRPRKSRRTSKKKTNKNNFTIVKQEEELSKMFFASVQKIYNQIIIQYKNKRQIKRIVHEPILYFLGSALCKIKFRQNDLQTTYQQFRYECQKLYRKSTYRDVMQFINYMKLQNAEFAIDFEIKNNHADKGQTKFQNKEEYSVQNKKYQNNKYQTQNNKQQNAGNKHIKNQEKYKNKTSANSIEKALSKTPNKNKNQDQLKKDKNSENLNISQQCKNLEQFLSNVPITSSIQSKKLPITPSSRLCQSTPIKETIDQSDNQRGKNETKQQAQIPQKSIQVINLTNIDHKILNQQREQSISMISDLQVKQNMILKNIYTRMNNINQVLNQLPIVLNIKQMNEGNSYKAIEIKQLQPKQNDQSKYKVQKHVFQNKENKYDFQYQKDHANQKELSKIDKIRQRYKSINSFQNTPKHAPISRNADKIDRLACRLQEHIRKNAMKIQCSKHARIML